MQPRMKVLENTFLYTFSSLLVRAINFIMLPIYTLFLSPADYGVINLVNVFITIGSYIIAFSLYSAIIRFYTDYRDDPNKLKRFYGTIICFVFISGVVFVSIGVIFKNIIINLFFSGIDFYPIIAIALASLFFICLHSVHQSILQGIQAGKKLTIINLVVFFFQVILMLVFLAILKLGLLGALLVTLLINCVYFFFMIFDLYRSNLICFCLDLKMLKDALKYSIPILPHNLSTYIASFASRIFMNNSGSLTTVGLFSVADQISNTIDVIQNSVNRAFTPWFFDKVNKNDENSKHDIVIFSQFLLLIYSLMYVVIGLFSQEVIIIMTSSSYISSWKVIPILVIAYSIKSIYYFYVNILFYYKSAANKIFIATLTGSFLDIILAYLLVPRYGMYGAAFSFLAAKVAVTGIVVSMSSRWNTVGYRLSKMLGTIASSMLFMGLGLILSFFLFPGSFSWINFLYKISLLLMYLVFVYLTNRKLIIEIMGGRSVFQILKLLAQRQR